MPPLSGQGPCGSGWRPGLGPGGRFAQLLGQRGDRDCAFAVDAGCRDGSCILLTENRAGLAGGRSVASVAGNNDAHGRLLMGCPQDDGCGNPWWEESIAENRECAPSRSAAMRLCSCWSHSAACVDAIQPLPARELQIAPGRVAAGAGVSVVPRSVAEAAARRGLLHGAGRPAVGVADPPQHAPARRIGRHPDHAGTDRPTVRRAEHSLLPAAPGARADRIGRMRTLHPCERRPAARRHMQD